jgi:large subunit ribosomal protein L21
MSNDFSVIETGSHQYRVSVGQKIKVEKLEVKAGDKVVFETVLLKSIGDAVEVGTPYITAKAEAKVLGDVRGEKKIVFRYHSKTRSRRITRN